MPRNTQGASSNISSVHTPVDPAQNPSSPYYIHPRENPAAVLVSRPLNGANYHSWARLMRRAMISKNKFRFVDGSSPLPDRFDPTFEAWQRCNNLEHSWLLNSVSPSIAQSLVYMDLASDVWKDLKERFSQGDLVRVVELQQEINSFKQGNLSVTDFFTEMKILWEELENYMPLPQCVCAVRCTCEAMRNAKKYRHQDCVIHFLMNLNENFSVIKTQVLLMDPLPSLNCVFSMVLQHERQSNSGGFNSLEGAQVVVNLAERKFAGKGRGNKNYNSKVCTHCGKTGHTIEVCYKKHGYPPGFKFRRSGTNVKCIESNDEVDSGKFDDAKSQEVVAAAPSFTHEEYKALLSLLHSN